MTRPPMTSVLRGSTGSDYTFQPQPADTSSPNTSTTDGGSSTVGATIPAGARVGTGTVVIPLKDFAGTDDPTLLNDALDNNKASSIYTTLETLRETVKGAINPSPAPAPVPAPAPAPTPGDGAASLNTPQASSYSSIGGSTSKTFVAEETAPATTVADDSKEKQQQLLMLAGVAAAGVALYYMMQQKRR